MSLFSFSFAFILYQGFPFKEPIYKNLYFLFFILLLGGYMICSLFADNIFDYKSKVLEYFIYDTRYPTFDFGQRFKFFILSILGAFLLCLIGKIIQI